MLGLQLMKYRYPLYQFDKCSIRKETDPLNVFDESWEDKYKQLEKFVINENLWIKFELLVKHEL